MTHLPVVVGASTAVVSASFFDQAVQKQKNSSNSMAYTLAKTKN